MSTEKFTLFYNGPFSQWHYARFTISGIEYVCAEQYMMAEKARLFGDDDALKAIMLTQDPYRQKMIGRNVENFDLDKWNAVAKDIVYKGNYAKFTQNEKLLKELMATSGTTLVEASPYDKIWGIGRGKTDPSANDRSKWKGTNWLGEVLTKLREDLYEAGIGHTQDH